MNWFPCFGANDGFPWIMLIFPLLFFAMMLLFCSRRRSYGFLVVACGVRRAITHRSWLDCEETWMI